MSSIPQTFQLFDHPAQMEPLLPADHRLAALLERAHDLIRSADQLSGKCRPGELDRADFKAMLGLGERQATAQVTALLKRGLLVTDSPYGKLCFGVPQHALHFYFPGLWPEAEGRS
jgi:hypothetical protein